MKKTILIFILALIPIYSYSMEVDTNRKIMSFGLYGGYNINMHTADFKELPGYPICCTNFTGGTGGGLNFGGLFEYYLDTKYSLELRLGLSDISGLLLENNLIGNTPALDANGNLVTTDEVFADYSIDANLKLFSIEPQFNYFILPNLTVSAGLPISFFATNTFSQKEVITDPATVTFKDTGSRTRNQYDDEEIPEISSMQMHLSFAVGYRLPMGRHLDITPEIKYYFALTDIASVDWKANTLFLGASIRYNWHEFKMDTTFKEIFIRDTTERIVAGLVKEEINLIDTSVHYYRYKSSRTGIYEIRNTYTEHYEKLLPRPVLLDLALKIVGINPDGSRVDNPKVIIEEIESSELFPILPYVFFDEGSADILKSRLKLLNKDETLEFSEDKLQWDIMDIYANMLNIVAYRLLQNPKAKIQITGTNKNLGTEKNNIALSKKRAGAIKKYLTDVWQIPAKRIHTKRRNTPLHSSSNEHSEGRAENQRAEIYSSNYNILKPLELKDVIKNITPPVLEIIPVVNAENKIAAWQYKIKQDDNKIATFDGKNKPKMQLWKIKQAPLPMTESDVKITLFVADDKGFSKSITENVKIEQLTIKEKRYEMKDDKRVERFSLILFDFDKAKVKPAHRKVLDMIKERIKFDSKVIISGYADKTGTPEHNLILASNRTKVIKNYLKINDSQVIVKNIGSDQLLYNNDTPEGRSYCRTVTITIETPVK